MQIEFQCNHCGATIEAESEISGIRAECPACQEAVMVPAPGIEPGMDIGGFRIDERLGVGGMGEVFGATQLAMDRKVALKILPPALTADEKTVERFLQEVRMAAKLEHPNIVTAFDAGKASGYHYLAMSYVKGEDLSERLKRDKRLPEAEALDIVDKIAHALDYAWTKHHLLHRDIKPANIMLTDEGVVKLMDMGIAKSLEEDSNLTMQGMLVGTPFYMSPEQATGSQDIDFRSDIYSLGATLYHLVTGVRPFNGPNAMSVIAKHMSETPMDPLSLNGDLSEDCGVIISKMLVRDRDDRFESWNSLRDALAQIRSGSSIAEAAAPTLAGGSMMVQEGALYEDTNVDTGADAEYGLGVTENIGLKQEETKAEPPPQLAATMAMPLQTEEPTHAAKTPDTTVVESDQAYVDKGVKWGVFGAAAAGILIILVLVGVVALIIREYSHSEAKEVVAKKETEMKERELVGDIASSLAGHEELKISREDLAEMLRLAKNYAADNPKALDEIEAKFQKVIKYAKSCKLPKYEMEAEAELDTIRNVSRKERHEANRKAAKHVLALLELKAEKLGKQYQNGPAAYMLTSYSGDYADQTSDDRNKLAEEYRIKEREIKPLEDFIRKAIRLFKAGEELEFRRHMETARNNSELTRNRALFRESVFPFLALAGQHNKMRRPGRGDRRNRLMGNFSKALVEYKKDNYRKAVELLQAVQMSLFKEVLTGEIGGELLKGKWQSVSFSGDGYTRTVKTMTIVYSGTKVAVNINGKGLKSGDGYIMGKWLHFKQNGRLKYWHIQSLKKSELNIQPLQDVTVKMRK